MAYVKMGHSAADLAGLSCGPSCACSANAPKLSGFGCGPNCGCSASTPRLSGLARAGSSCHSGGARLLGFACGAGCPCAPCRTKQTGLGERYVPDDDDNDAPAPPRVVKPGQAVQVTPAAGARPGGAAVTTAAVSGLGGFGWFVNTRFTRAGHEELTRRAASGLVPTPTLDYGALIEGVRRPDTASLTAHLHLGQQRRHFLRSHILQTQSAAYADAIGQLRDLHRRILGTTSDRREQFRLIGEALHLIQDSYSPAHVKRDATGRISRIMNYGPANLVAPAAAIMTPPLGPFAIPLARREHLFPADPRDSIYSTIGGSTLKPEAMQALVASRTFLQMFLPQLSRSPSDPANASELTAFIETYLRR